MQPSQLAAAAVGSLWDWGYGPSCAGGGTGCPRFRDPLDEVDEIPIDDELVEEHIGAGEAFLQTGTPGGSSLISSQGGEGPADCGGDGGPLLLRIEVFDNDEALINEGQEMWVG